MLYLPHKFMKSPLLFLFETEKESLKEIEKKEEDWRARLRAKILLLLTTESNAVRVAEMLEVHPKTVRQTRQRWEKEKFGILHDKVRPGAPKKLTEQERERLHEWAKQEPLNSKQLLAKHLEFGGQPVHFNTIVNELKGLGLVWKRTRHSLKKNVKNKPSGRQQ